MLLKILFPDAYPSGRVHDDVIKWKHFPRYWPFVRGIHRWIPRTKASDAELWCFLCSAWINGWVNYHEAGDLRRHRARYEVTIMCTIVLLSSSLTNWPLGGSSSFNSIIIIQNSVLRTCFELALRWMPQNLAHERSPLVQTMAWCRLATSHYLSQCWPRFCRHVASLGQHVLTVVECDIDEILIHTPSHSIQVCLSNLKRY